MCKTRTAVVLGILLIGWGLSPRASAQALKADYQFRNTLESTRVTAPALENLGENTYAAETLNGLKRLVLHFPQGSGVMLSGARRVFAGDAYSLVIWFRFETTASWRRLVDFKNATSDLGLYLKDGQLQFYNIALGTDGVVQPNTWVQVMLTRDAKKKVCGYLNGRLQFTFVDDADNAAIGEANTLRFFRDDGAEHSAGDVAQIRIYDGALTVAQAPPHRPQILVSANRQRPRTNDRGRRTGDEPAVTRLCRVKLAIGGR